MNYALVERENQIVSPSPSVIPATEPESRQKQKTITPNNVFLSFRVEHYFFPVIPSGA